MRSCNGPTLVVFALIVASGAAASCGETSGKGASTADREAPAEPSGAPEVASTAETHAGSGASAEKEPASDPLGSAEPASRAESSDAAGAEQRAPTSTAPEETRTLEVIRKIFLENRQKVRDCYERARKDQPNLRGDLVVHFVLSARGAVKQVELNRERSTLTEPKVVDCALDVVRGFTFPPSSRHLETTGNYPFNFVP